MNKSDESVETIETVEATTPKPEPKVIEAPKEGYFFPNILEGKPFGGEFSSKEEAEAANEQYLKENK